MNTAQVVVARDGRRALLFEEMDLERYPAPNPDGFNLIATVRLRPREKHCCAQIFVSGTFRALWNAPGQQLRWQQDFDGALPDLARIAMAEFLDTNELPRYPADDEYGLKVAVTSDLFGLFKRASTPDAELESYVEARIYWAWRYKIHPTAFQEWEARRLSVDVADLHQAAFRRTGSLWQVIDDGLYQPLPALVERFEAKLDDSTHRQGAGPTKYDVALSFAGEQRSYVQAVAERLKNAGASVFYDGFVDLWGKDLTLELERVYRNQARYVIIFVSKEYVEKAWPNLERQHALAGRIERMDDSVLPARFDDVSLPGLPSTVGYLDISNRKPEEVADLVLTKLNRVDA